jgi:hypothetical protein
MKTKTQQKTVSIRYDEPIEVYHSNYEYLSTSALKHGLKSMKELRWFLDGKLERKASPAFEIGKAFELAMMSPQLIEKQIAVLDMDARPEPTKTMSAKLNKDWLEKFKKENKDKINISADDWQDIEFMLQSFRENYILNALVDECTDQLSVYWTDEETGVKLKTRPDLVNLKRGVVIDIKTIPDGSPDSFKRQVRNYDYWLQAIMQIDGITKANEAEHILQNNLELVYYWLVFEKNPPYNVTLYEFDQQSMAVKWNDYRNLLEEVAKSQRTNRWGGYEVEGATLGAVNLSL